MIHCAYINLLHAVLFRYQWIKFFPIPFVLQKTVLSGRQFVSSALDNSVLNLCDFATNKPRRQVKSYVNEIAGETLLGWIYMINFQPIFVLPTYQQWKSLRRILYCQNVKHWEISLCFDSCNIRSSFKVAINLNDKIMLNVWETDQIGERLILNLWIGKQINIFC